ncbi:P-loop containing nucleoside triphosphate hydrolase protein [Armillaria borealis]|uniref:DNA 3'-5' helicase n=1 Tax=Armillaria borealis TaxID=47425 RepID=A0AA39ML21_9AGAR|nr:P-loop containing nucleoside triphosphate hydrolase protein [Armillaria borealis]
MDEQFGWAGAGARSYQVDASAAQLKMQDVLVNAGTGLGKTAVAAGPHTHPSSEGKVTLMISPLIALHDEQVDSFRSEYKLRATAVNSSNGGCKPEILREIVKGEHQIVLISPEMALSRRFIREVLRNAEFGRRILSVVVDEAHVVSHWGAQFRKQCGKLGMLRAFLPGGTPFVALSATLPPRIKADVLEKLQFSAKYVDIDEGNDRHNVSIVVRAMQNAMNTYADLDFLIPPTTTTSSDIKKTFIYADNLTTGGEIIDHLTNVLPSELRQAGLIRPYNAAFSKEYRKKAMSDFKAGDIRILVCTDAAGMGCNIPVIDVVVQWKLPDSMSAFVQRVGRAARAAGHTGMAVLLVQPSAYTVDLVEEVMTTLKKKSARDPRTERPPSVSEAETKRRAQRRKAYAIAHGVYRGQAGGALDAIREKSCPPLNPLAVDEGLLVFVQTGTCRRRVLMEIYKNTKPLDLTVPCCDICNPELLDHTRPGIAPKAKKKPSVKNGATKSSVKTNALRGWRETLKQRLYPSPLVSSSAIMNDEIVELLASAGPIESLDALTRVLAGHWRWIDKLGHELHEFLLTLDIQPHEQPQPRKRTAQEPEEASSAELAGSLAVVARPKRQKTAPNASPHLISIIPDQNPYPIPSASATPATASQTSKVQVAEVEVEVEVEAVLRLQKRLDRVFLMPSLRIQD